MPIFPTPIDLDADYDWGGLHTFEFPATFEAGINTEAITSSGNLVTTVVSGGQGQYYFGANPIYLMSATEFRPAEALTAVSLGSATRRWTNVYGVDGDFSGTVDVNKLTFDGDTNTHITNVGGADWMSFTVGGTSWLSMSKASVDRYSWFNANQNTAISFRVGYNGGTGIDMDGATGRVAFGTGISTEVGGSNRLFNLGSDGDTDTEYLELSASANVFTLEAKKSGAGVVRDFNVKANDGDFSGNITAENLPTSDPGVPGQLYVTTGGALKVSQ